MSDSRLVAMTAEQSRILDEILVPTLMRGGETEMASHMMALALAWRFAPQPEPERPSNVYPIVKHVGDNWSQRAGA